MPDDVRPARWIGKGEEIEFEGFLGERIMFTGKEIDGLSDLPDAGRFVFMAYLTEDEDTKPWDFECFDPDDPEHGEANRGIVADFEAGLWHFVCVNIDGCYSGYSFGITACVCGMELDPNGNPDTVTHINEMLRDRLLKELAEDAMAGRSVIVSAILAGEEPPRGVLVFWGGQD